MCLEVWLTRDLDDTICIFFKKPSQKVDKTFYEKTVIFAKDIGFKDSDFKWLTYENSPKRILVETKLDIKE